MTFEQFEKLGQHALRHEAKMAFDRAYEHNAAELRLIALTEAQFYMQELDRRHDSSVSIRDLILELIVIALIGVEIWLGWKQGVDQDSMMTKQNAILSSLQTATQATADQMKEQLAMQYSVFINPQLNGNTGIVVYNNSPAEISLWGVKIGNRRPAMNASGPAVIFSRGEGSIEFKKHYGLELRDEETKAPLPINLYLTNAAGQEFVWSGRLRLGGDIFAPPDGTLRAEKWRGQISASTGPSKAP